MAEVVELAYQVQSPPLCYVPFIPMRAIQPSLELPQRTLMMFASCLVWM
jgi:hypothetical protein